MMGRYCEFHYCDGPLLCGPIEQWAVFVRINSVMGRYCEGQHCEGHHCEVQYCNGPLL